MEELETNSSKEKYLHFRSSVDPWETPAKIFEPLNEIFSFDLDAAACATNAKCPQWLGPESPISEDAFSIDWEGSVFLNPPYGRQIRKWIEKAKASAKGDTSVVCLLPARTDTKWFQLCWEASYIVFVSGRIYFGGAETPAPFPSAVVVFGEPKALPPDRELTFLSELGTVVRPVWRYAPIHRVLYETAWSCPWIDTVKEYRRAIDPEERGPIPSEFINFYTVKDLSDIKPSLPKLVLPEEEKEDFLDTQSSNELSEDA